MEERKSSARVNYHLSDLDQPQAQARQGHCPTPNYCPICWKDFQVTTTLPMVGSDGLSIKVLSCGHGFDDTCWIAWTRTRVSCGSTCPICREQALEAEIERLEDDLRKRWYKQELYKCFWREERRFDRLYCERKRDNRRRRQPLRDPRQIRLKWIHDPDFA